MIVAKIKNTLHDSVLNLVLIDIYQASRVTPFDPSSRAQPPAPLGILCNLFIFNI